MILQDLKESPEPLEVAKSWISDSLGPQTARVTAQPKRNWPIPFEAAAAEVVANWEGLWEQPAIFFIHKKVSSLIFLVQPVFNVKTLRILVWPSISFMALSGTCVFFPRSRGEKKNVAETHQKKHLFGSHEAEGFFRMQAREGHIFWWPSFGSKLGNFPPRHYQPPKTSTKTATCQMSFKDIFGTVLLVVWKKNIIWNRWLKLFRCLFFCRICSLNSDVLRLRWHARSLVMDPQPISGQSFKNNSLLPLPQKNQLKSFQLTTFS